MNAPTSIAKGDPVEAFRGWEREDRKDKRRRILRCRDNASVRAISAQSPDARAMLWHIHEMAAAWAWSSAPDADLEVARKAFVRAGLAATNLEELWGRHG